MVRGAAAPRLSIALTQMQQGWRIAALTGTPRQEPIVASEVDGRLMLAADQPSDVVAVADPDTGATLLVGTQHRPGQGVSFSRRSTEFILRPTLQGVVVEPLSDTIALKQAPNGFSLSGAQSGLALSKATNTTRVLMDAAHLTRRLNFSSMPKEALLRLAIKQLDDAAATPPQAAAQGTMRRPRPSWLWAFRWRAESLLHMASDQDPKEAASSDTRALTAIAALLAGRPEESVGLMDPKLDGTDEIALWAGGAAGDAGRGLAQGRGGVLGHCATGVFSIPATIRDRILPLMAETMIQGGEIEPAARPAAPGAGRSETGLRAGAAAPGRGRRRQGPALYDAIANGAMTSSTGRGQRSARWNCGWRPAPWTRRRRRDALDKLLYAWRGDSRELALRQRVAELRGQAGAWRPALAMLRQAETDFPEQAAPIHDRLKDAFAAMIGDKGAQQVPADRIRGDGRGKHRPGACFRRGRAGGAIPRGPASGT